MAETFQLTTLVAMEQQTKDDTTALTLIWVGG